MTKTNFEVSKPYFRRANQADPLHHLTAAIATITKTSKTLTYEERETNLGESMLSSLSGDAGVVTVLGERPRRLTPNAAPPPPPPASPARPVPGGRESTVNPSLAAAEGGGRGKPASEAADGGARHYPDDLRRRVWREWLRRAKIAGIKHHALVLKRQIMRVCFPGRGLVCR